MKRKNKVDHFKYHYPLIKSRADYEKFKAAVEASTKGITDISTGGYCEYCADWSSDPFFSHTPCDTCNRELAGNRYTAHGYDKYDHIAHFNVCEDCLYYLEYGQLDDDTMDNLEE